MSELEFIDLADQRDLTPQARELLVEYLWLPDFWKLLGPLPDQLPPWLQSEVDAFPGAATVLVALTSTQLVGQVELLGLEGAGSALELKRMYVRPAWQGRGVGRTLVQQAVLRARTLGAQYVVLDVMRSRRAALRLYESSGFVPTAPFRTYPDQFDMVFMRHEL